MQILLILYGVRLAQFWIYSKNMTVIRYKRKSMFYVLNM